MTPAHTWLPRNRGHIAIRALRESDLSALYELESDPILKQFVGGPVKAPRNEWIDQARRLCTSDNTFALEYVPTGSFAGRASVGHFLRHCDPAHREIQIILAKPFLGCGLGREACLLLCELAFDLLDASSVFAVVDPAHQASLRLVTALKFAEVEPQVNSSGQIEKRVFQFSRKAYTPNWFKPSCIAY